jgi:cytochrome c553
VTAPLKSRCWLVCVGAAVVVVLGLILYAWSGLYNIAASEPHLEVTHWFLDFGMRRAVSTHSLTISAPDLDDPDLITLGAEHFQGGCATCHGAPNQTRSPIVEQMLPRPPDLTRAAKTWTAEQLFWIVKHGLKFTGMPAWVAQGRDDEVWAVVAFLRALPDITSSRYRVLAIGEPEVGAKTGFELTRTGASNESLTQCVRCHREDVSPPRSKLVPRLRGQSKPYLERALRDYASGLRQSGVMQPIAAALDIGEMKALADYYAQLPTSGSDAGSLSPSAEAIARGRDIAVNGVPEGSVPPCLVCHGEKTSPFFPQLHGQFAPYIVEQIRLWQRGLRGNTGYGAIMAAIASRLDEQQAKDVAAYFESAPLASEGPRMPSTPRRPLRRNRGG